MEREQPLAAESGIVLWRPRIAEVEAFLDETWHAPILRDEAQQHYEAWIALARAGLVKTTEGCLADVWRLRRQDSLASFTEFAERSGIPLQPLEYVEPSAPRGVYWVVRPAKLELTPASLRHSRLKRALKAIGRRLADRLVLSPEATRRGESFVERLPWRGGRFRMYPLRHPGTMERLRRFPPEVATWAFLLGQRSEVESAVVFEKYLEPDPILAVQVGGKWFEITRWE